MRRLLTALALLLTAPGAALAHPHVLVDVHALVEFKDGRIVSLFMGWKFDPVFSASLLKDFDKNGDNRLDAGEMKTLENEAFRDTKEQAHFTYARIGDQAVVWKDATDFKVVGASGNVPSLARATGATRPTRTMTITKPSATHRTCLLFVMFSR